MSYPHETVNSQVGVNFALADKYGDETFMCAKFKNGEPCEEWVEISWKDAAGQIKKFGAGLIEMGINKNDRVAIFAHNRPRWVISDLGIQGAGGIGVPVYPTSTDSQLEFILNDCGATAIVVGDQALLDQALKVKPAVPALKFIVTMMPVKGNVNPDVVVFDDILAKGAKSSQALAEFDKRKSAISLDDVAAIIYTSGTTGNPKGVVLTQGNFQAQNILTLGAPFTQKILERGIRFTTLCHLPLCHIMGRASDYHAQMALGSTIYFAESIAKVQKNLLEVRPQLLASIPRLYEKVYEGVQQYSSRLTGYKKKVFDWSIESGNKATEYMVRGEKLPFGVSIKFALSNILVFRHVRRMAGLDRLTSAISGGGALSPEITSFFRAMNVIIAEGYGLTETTSPVAWNGPRFHEPLPDKWIYKKAFEWLIDAMVVMQGRGKNPFTSPIGLLKIVVASKLVIPKILIKPGFVGRPLDGTDIKLAEDGEILVKGPQVFEWKKGYFNQKEKTDEVFTEDGYFKTGDIGTFDKDGFLKITDRKKELLVTSGGKNIAPQPIELALIVDPFIDQACVIGDGRKFISALIVPQYDILEKYAREKGINYRDSEDLICLPEIKAFYTEKVAKINEKFAKYEQIKKFQLLPHSFSLETGELTPTLKMKRRVIYDKYSGEIESMYV